MVNNVVNNKWVVKFEHHQELISPKRSLERELTETTTYCRIFTLDDCKKNAIPVLSGYSICKPVDNFNKSKGLKLSLKRALSNSSFNKTERKQFWEWLKDYSPRAFKQK